MKSRKFGMLLFICLITFFIGCSPSANPKKTEDDDVVTDSTSGTPSSTSSNKTDGQKLKFINLPYGSEGLKIVARVKSGTNYKNYDIGTVTSSALDAYVEKTIKFPKSYDEITFFFVDDEDNAIYYIPLTDDFYDETTGVYVMEGYYYYYYEFQNSTKPFAACSEHLIENLEFDVNYAFDSTEKPFLLFKASNVKDKIIGISGVSSWNIQLYASADKDKIMTYTCDEYDEQFYECTTDDVYFMIKPYMYGYTDVTATIKFTDVLPKIQNSLKIMKSFFASDGYMYVSGTNTTHVIDLFLYRYDVTTGKRTVVKNFGTEINAITEVDEGKLIIAHRPFISIMDLETGDVSTLATDMPNNIDAIVNYKDNKLAITGKKPGFSTGTFIIMDKQTGTWKEVEEINMQLGQGEPDLAVDLFYFSDLDLFIHGTTHTTPYDISFTKIKEDSGALKFYSMEPYYDYDSKSPIKLLSTSPLKFLSAEGNVFTIHPDKIIEPLPEGYQYYNSSHFKDWCSCEESIYNPYNDCYITDEYIYYMYAERFADHFTVTKCALSNPKEVIAQREYEKQKGIRFFFTNNKLYLLANGTEAIYWVNSERDYDVFFHEIDF